MFELIWSIAGESPEKGLLSEIASSSDLDPAKRDLLQNIAKKNILRCFECGGENREYFLHLPIVLAGQSFHLLERGGASEPADSGLNQGKQTRVWYAHQRLLRNTRAISAGPARLLRERSLWPQIASDHPGNLSRKEPSIPPLAPMRAAAWGKVAGDCGWAGLPLEAYKRQQPCRIKLPKDLTAQMVLELLVESQSLLEALVRWRIPLAYQAWLPAKYANVAWQLAHSMRDMTAPASPTDNEFTIDLTQPLGEANNSFAENAREGNWVQWQQLNPESNPLAKGSKPTTGQASPQTEEADGYQLRPISHPAADSPSPSQFQPRFRRSVESQEEGAGRSPAVWFLIILAALIPLTAVSYLLYRFWPFQAKTNATSAQADSPADDSDDNSKGEGSFSPTRDTPREALLASLAQQIALVRLPEGPTQEAVPLLEFAEQREEIRQLEFGLALPKAFLNLSFFPGPENEDLFRNLKSNLGEENAPLTEAEVRLRRVNIGAMEKTLLLWRWLTPPPNGNEANWRMGALQVGEKGKPPKLNLALEAPQRESSRALLSLILDPPEIPYSHSTVSKLPTEIGKSPWVVDSLELAELPTAIRAEGSVTWNRSQRNLDDLEYSFAPDREQLESKIRRRLNTERYSKAEQAITEEILKHPNLGFCLATTLIADAPTEEEKLAKLKILPQIIIPSPQESEERRDGNIVSTKIDPTLSEAALKETILAELNRLNASDYRLTQAEVERLGDWLDSPPAVAPDPDDCRLLTRYLIAEELQQAVSEALAKPLRFRVVRRTELQTKTGSQVFLLPAFLFE